MKGRYPFDSRTSKGVNKVTRKIFDWTTIALTFALTMSALGVVGSFELGDIDFAGFFIGQAVCIAGIAPVSYTHLDVYKRQLQCHIRMQVQRQLPRVTRVPSYRV